MLVTPYRRSEVLQAWGDWLYEIGGWEWFVTITLRDPHSGNPSHTKPGFAAANRAWDAFTSFVRPAVGYLQWVRFFEMQRDRGVLHVHGLVKGLDSKQYSLVSHMLWQRFGFNRILEYDPKLGATHYITKYVVKDLGDVRFSEPFFTQR